MPLHQELLPPEDKNRTRAELWRRRMAQEAHIARRAGRRPPPDAFQNSPKVLFARAVLRLLGVYEQGVDNALRPELREVRFDFAHLPAGFDGFRILQMSDFHFRGWPGFLDRVCAPIKGLEVDLCVLTGDFRYNNGASSRYVYSGLERLLRQFETAHGTLAVLGNNDTGEFADGFARLGINVLVNRNHPVCVGADTLWFAGTDDPHDYRADSLRHAVAGIPNGAFVVGLIHSPELYEAAARCGIDLYLCGHTHAGQIRLPRIGAIFRNTRCPFRLMQGRWQIGGMQGYTSAGVGTSTLPVRYNCPPEVTVITLVRA